MSYYEDDSGYSYTDCDGYSAVRCGEWCPHYSECNMEFQHYPDKRNLYD